MKKIIASAAISLSVIAVIALYLPLSPKTLDFRGTVTEIRQSGSDTVFYVSKNETLYTVTADSATEVSYCCADDPDITLSEIRVGDTVEGNYRKLFEKSTARFIIVMYES